MTLLTLFSLVSCNQTNETPNQALEGNPYILPNGLAPTELLNEVQDFILDIYMPFSQESIDKAIDDFCKVATEAEIEELKSTVGAFDKEKRAKVSNLQLNFCMPDNSSNHTYKVLATFTITLKDVQQNLLIEFQLNNDCIISSHSIWVNNNIL